MAEIKRYALVKDGVTVNIIVWDGETPYTPPDGMEVMPEEKAPPMIQPEPE